LDTPLYVAILALTFYNSWSNNIPPASIFSVQTQNCRVRRVRKTVSILLNA